MLGQGRRLRRPLPQLSLLPPSSAEGGIVPAPAPLLRRSCTDFSSGYSLMQDRKLRKILSGEQYPRWRTRHPRKFIPMPEPVFMDR